jgi:hypothetical protein
MNVTTIDIKQLLKHMPDTSASLEKESLFVPEPAVLQMALLKFSMRCRKRSNVLDYP